MLDLVAFGRCVRDVDGPFKDFSAVVVYHPEEGNGHAFANVGFIGWVGALTGQSAAQMAISEIGALIVVQCCGARFLESTLLS